VSFAIESTREGRENVWRLKRERIQRAREHLDLVSRQWDDAIDRLRAQVEG
jgi:hypothetical protein